MTKKLSGFGGLAAAALTLGALACSEDTPGAGPGATTGGTGGAAGSAAGGTDPGGAGGGGTSAGSGGSAGNGALAGAGGDALAGAAGSGGAAGAGGGEPAVFGKLTCNPGAEGNGVHETGNVPPPEWTLGADVTPGTLTSSADFVSDVYGGGYVFPYRIYTSANYVAGQPALFLVFGDGGMYLGNAYRTPTVLDNLTATGALLPTVAVFVEPGSDRVGTYDPPTDKYARFLTEELIPEVILPTYSISRDPDAWATIGYSASGEAGFAVVWHRPEQFHNFIGHSASFGASIRYDNWVWADKIQESPMRELRVSLTVAAQGDLTDDRGSWRTINENVAAALAAKGNPYRLIIGPGDHGGLASQQDFPNALRWMWRNCQFAP